MRGGDTKMTVQEIISLVANVGPVTVMALYAMRIMETTIKANTEAINRLSAKMEDKEAKHGE